MQAIFIRLPLLVKMSGEASILILLALIVQWLFRRGLRPRWRYALWVLVMLRLALPWSIPSPASLFNVLKMPAADRLPPPEIGPVPMTRVETMFRSWNPAPGGP